MDVGETLHRATALRREKKYEEALALLEPLLNLEHPPTGALLSAAALLRLTGAPDGVARAEQCLRRATELDPRSIEAELELAYLLFTYGDGAPPELFPHLERAEALMKEAEIDLALLRSDILLCERRYQEAYD